MGQSSLSRIPNSEVPVDPASFLDSREEVQSTEPESEPEPHATLCAPCQALLRCPDKALEETITVAYSIQQHSVFCPICVLLQRLKVPYGLDSVTELQLSPIAFPGALQLELKKTTGHVTSSLIFFAMASGNKEPRIEHRDENGKHSISDPICLRPEVFHTKDEECLSQVQDWISICVQKHKTCAQRGTKGTLSRLPTRLIDVRNKPRLVETTSETFDAVKVRYATLSHRWKSGHSAKLLRSNLSKMKRKIGGSYLPPIFRDSVIMAKWLGIDFLWIDALCIVQDDPQDWRTEASRMGSVYANAFINFGASVAASFRGGNNNLGLFTRREQLSKSVAQVSVARLGIKKNHYAMPYSLCPVVDGDLLMERGWIFQERVLSPRSVYFGRQINWECNEILANELFPEGISHAGPQPLIRTLYNRPKRLHNLMSIPSSYFETNSARERREWLHTQWLTLMELYSDCKFTYDSDVFPALSGIAESFQSQLQDRYLAGLWTNDIIRGLCWGVEEKSRTLIPLHHDYIAPSWSWAAVRVKVDFYAILLWGPRYIANVLEAEVTSVGNCFMGPFTRGFIRIAGDLRPNQRIYCPQARIKRYNIDQSFEIYDNEYDESGGRHCKDTFFLALIYGARLKQVHGLILERVGEAKDEYKRVGAFNFLPHEREEFKGFDWGNLERQTVTIV